MGEFRGVDVIRLTLSADTTNYDIRVAAGSPTQRTTVVLTINSGVYVYATTTSEYGVDTGTGWASGSTIYIINNGNIAGRGGAGGNGAGNSAATAGGAGGPALHVQLPTTIDNNGTIAGGGGGGGGGAGRLYSDGKGYTIASSGGGGGGGRVNGVGGSNPNVSGHTIDHNNGTSGTTATLTTTGSGGGGSSGNTVNAGAGGAAGAWGSAGSAGSSGSGPGSSGTPGGGGAAGAYLVGQANVTWISTGTRLGTAS